MLSFFRGLKCNEINALLQKIVRFSVANCMLEINAMLDRHLALWEAKNVVEIKDWTSNYIIAHWST